MPVLKIKNNGVWEQVSGIPDHTHVIDDITDFPSSLPANGGNADTVDGKHASDFASAAEMTTVQNDINDINTVLNGIEIPTTLPNPNALTFTGAANASYDGSSEVNVEIPSAYGATETVIFSLDSVTFVNNEDGNMAASINMPMPFTEAGIYRVKIGDHSGIINILQKSIDEWNDNYRFDGYYNIDLSGGFTDEKNLNEAFPDGFSYYKGTLNLYDNSIEAGEYPVGITKITKMDIYPSIKMNKVNPTAIGSFSLNRKHGSLIGDYSHAEGNNTTASGVYSHAEGNNTTASGAGSHAEGYYTTTSMRGSHAEGWETKALGEGSHAEGYNTTASAYYSHAEGSYTTASGNESHAEGQHTTAPGQAAHAEGSWTKASSSNQHVQGEYNIEDSSSVYADIIGNGTYSKPSNAATVDWHGNAWYAGDVYVGSTSGTNKDEGSKKLATEEYVDNSTANIVIPATLPNPNALTFTGAVNASYDGSSEMSVKIPGALSDLSEDATHRVVTDAEKAKWNAKSNFSGSYNDLTDKPTIPDVPVQSVNGKTGAVVLSAEDVGALPGSTVIPEALPNPNALTFTGAAEGTYDGSNPLTVEIPVGADGKSAYQYAVEGGYTGTETKFAEKLAQEQLSGTTNDLTPTQVYEAVSAGIPVKVQYTDSTYGLSSFTAFNVSESMNVIASNAILNYQNTYLLAALYGDKSTNGWFYEVMPLAKPSDIPSALPNPHALTFTGAVTGSYDGSAPLSVNIPTVDDVLAALPAWEGGSY